MNNKHHVAVQSFILDLMQKVRTEPMGLFDYPMLTTTAGKYYSAAVFTWDTHHMTLRYAMNGEAEFMKYFLLTMLKFQRSNGFVSCTCNSVDGAVHTRGFHAQPYLAQNAAIYLNAVGDTATVSEIYGKLEKYLDYWEKTYSAPYGLYRWGEAWMSGFDNEITGTIFPTGSIISPDLAALLYLEYRAMGFIARKLGADDRRFEQRASEIKNAVNEYLWSEEMQTYSAFNLLNNKVITSFADQHLAGEVGKYAYISCPALLVLFAGIAEPRRAKQMIERYVLSPEHFRSPFGIRSLSRSSEYYNNARWGNPPRFGEWSRLTNSNWQGPVWIPLSWFVMHALLRYGYRQEAELLADDTVELVYKSISTLGFMRENFDGETGEGLYADNFASWNILTDKFHLYTAGKGLPIFPWENA